MKLKLQYDFFFASVSLDNSRAGKRMPIGNGADCSCRGPEFCSQNTHQAAHSHL